MAAWQSEVNELVLDFNQGLYTEAEVVSFCLEIFAKHLSLEMWRHFPEWIRSGIKEITANFNEESEVVTFGRGDPLQAKRDLLQVKRWLIDNA